VLCNVLESSRGYSFCRNQPEAAQLLIDAGADVNSVAQGVPLLTYAAVNECHRILRLLAQHPSIQLNAHVFDMRSDNGFTPTLMATVNNHGDIVALLAQMVSIIVYYHHTILNVFICLYCKYALWCVY